MSFRPIVDFDRDPPLVNEQIGFLCDFCDQTLPSRGKLMSHLQTHICMDPACQSCRPSGGAGSSKERSRSTQLQAVPDCEGNEFVIPKKLSNNEVNPMRNGLHDTSRANKSSQLHEAKALRSARTHKFFCVECDHTCYSKQDLEKHVLSHNNPETIDSIQDDAVKTGNVNDSQHTSDSSDFDSMFATECKQSTPYKCTSSEIDEFVHEEVEDYELSLSTMDSFDSSSVAENGSYTETKSDQDKRSCSTKLKTGGPSRVAIDLSGSHSYFCPKCDRGFAKKGNLTRHIESHSVVKPKNRFKCSYCGLTFVSKFNLKRHESLHLPSKLFTCELCEKSFPNKYYLRYHMSSHSNVRKYICKVCDNVYKTLHGLTVHSQKHSNSI